MTNLRLALISIALIFINSAVLGQVPLKKNNALTQYLKEQEALRTKRSAAWIKDKKVLPIIYSNGFPAQLIGGDENNFPIYYKSESNFNAARSLGTHRLWTGGNLGLKLDGQNMVIGEWDGGKVRATHDELTGRVTQKDNATTLSDHATHVAGTLIGSGAKAAAKGMSWKAELHAYDWVGDASEMSNAAADSLLISNHSYGQIRAWFFNETSKRWEWYGDTAVSATEDWRNGFYDFQSKEWDDIAYSNPYYLIIKSAGNERNEKPQDTVKTHYVWDNSSFAWVPSTTSRPSTGPYDCMAGASVSKNILTIAAVENLPSFTYTKPSDVKMSSFSSWGPTDDGRIKPDLSGVGVGLESSLSTGDDKYATYNGTSMAAPNIAGSLLLLQQHFLNKHNRYMRAASLKGLAIHTAREAGTTDGPDYAFGWGMLDMAKCIATIDSFRTTSLLFEDSLSNKGQFSTKFLADGIANLTATLVWNDPSANPLSSGSLNVRTARLVNDLDIKIVLVSDTSKVYYPWLLDPENPAQAATQGNNVRDNVERVDMGKLPKGEYQLTINHKGNLHQQKRQHFSLWLSNVAADVQVGFNTEADTICEGDRVSYSAQIAGIYDSLEWKFVGGSPSTSKSLNPNVRYNSGGSFRVTLIAYQNGKKDSLSINNRVLVNNLPQTALDTFAPVCAYVGGVVELTSGMPVGGNYFGTAVSNSRFYPDSAGVGSHWIYYSYTSNKGCTAIDSQSIKVNPVPANPTISQNGDTLISTAANFYQWTLGGVEISNANNQQYFADKSGDYRLIIRNGEGCEAISPALNIIKTGLKTQNDPLEVNVYPNPFDNRLYFETDKMEFPIALKFYDFLGKLHLTITLNESGKLSTETLSAGSYILEIENGNTAARMLIIKR